MRIGDAEGEAELDALMAAEEIDGDDTGAPIRERTERRSYEWLRFEEGENPICWSPWRVLKVDIFGRTQHCCGFFEKLPAFEWPSAREFHAETGLWNGPHAQYLRRTMGTSAELPFCTFCKTDDRRHPGSAHIKAQTSLDSSRAFQRIYDKNAPFPFRGRLSDLPEDIRNWTIPAPTNPERVLRPFSQDRLFFRRFARIWGFWQAGRVLQIGVGGGAWAPFLAEANTSLDIADRIPGRLINAMAICDALGLDNVSATRHGDIPLSYEDAGFDAIWLSGTQLSGQGRAPVLEEMRRLLRPGGRLMVIGAPGVAQLVRRAQFAVSDEEAERLATRIEQGPADPGPDNYFNTATLIRVLKPFRLQLTQARPALTRYANGRGSTDETGVDYPELAARVRQARAQRSNTDLSTLPGMAETVSFTATAI